MNFDNKIIFDTILEIFKKNLHKELKKRIKAGIYIWIKDNHKGQKFEGVVFVHIDIYNFGMQSSYVRPMPIYTYLDTCQFIPEIVNYVVSAYKEHILHLIFREEEDNDSICETKESRVASSQISSEAPFSCGCDIGQRDYTGSQKIPTYPLGMRDGCVEFEQGKGYGTLRGELDGPDVSR